MSGCALPPSWMNLAPGPVCTILESGGAGRWSYFSDSPARVIIGGESSAEIRSGDLTILIDRKTGGPLEIAQAVLATRKPAPLRLENGMGGGFVRSVRLRYRSHLGTASEARESGLEHSALCPGRAPGTIYFRSCHFGTDDCGVEGRCRDLSRGACRPVRRGGRGGGARGLPLAIPGTGNRAPTPCPFRPDSRSYHDIYFGGIPGRGLPSERLCRSRR